MAIFGLITSIPPQSGNTFDPLAEFEENTSMSREMHFEKAFRGMFDAMEGMESFVKYSRYPNITVHPIAVFRPFRLTDKENLTETSP